MLNIIKNYLLVPERVFLMLRYIDFCIILIILKFSNVKKMSLISALSQSFIAKYIMI
jgi:hypothetical protein